MASVLVGQTSENRALVTGTPFAQPSEYEEVELLIPISPPYPPPFEDFGQAFQASFYSPLGFTVVERAYARGGDPFVVFDLVINNVTGDNLDGVYVGLFADWDIGDFEQNLGGFDEGTNLVYVFDDSNPETRYSGVAALSVDEVSGWTLEANGVEDRELYDGLTDNGAPLTEPQDVRTVLGVGPFNLAPGDSARARFAMLAEESLAAITASAQAAQAVFAVATEQTPPEGQVVLRPVYPNPSAERAEIGFTLTAAQAVRLAVYDVLGREVAVLADGVRPAGEQTVTFDASALPSGVYVVRLQAGAAALTQQLTVVR